MSGPAAPTAHHRPDTQRPYASSLPTSLPSISSTPHHAPSLADLPYIHFLSAYPFPAFLLPSSHSLSKLRPSLHPIFINPSFRALVHGPEVDNAEEVGGGLLEALDGVGEAQKLGDWMERMAAGKGCGEETCVIALRPKWLPTDAPPVSLELTTTRMSDFWVCTSVPRSPIPKYTPPSNPTSRPDSNSGRGSLDAARTRTTSQLGPAPGMGLEPPSGRAGEMEKRVAEYDWGKTTLGAIATWPQSLRSMISYVLASPYPTCLWWGPSFVLIYNDAYADMAGSKHPYIFGQAGSVAWGELWESIGPLAREVIAGKAVAKQDDLLFFDRLTSAMLPEETYHSWSWIPVLQEDNTVGGLVNSTFETTSKVLSTRRLDALRDLASSTALSRTRADYAAAVLQILASCSLDLPFAALYFCSVDENGGTSGVSADSLKSHQHKSSVPGYTSPIAPPPFQVSLRLAGTVGVPEGHPSMPPLVELLLDPITLQASPPPAEPFERSSSSSYPGSTNGGSSTDSVSTLKLHSHKSSSPPGTSTGDRSEPASASTFSDTASAFSANTITPAYPRQRTALTNSTLWPFAEALASRRPVHMNQLPTYLVEGFERRGWSDPLREAVVIPLSAEGGELSTAVLVVGLNTRLPYDAAFQTFVEITRMSLSSTLQATLAREADIKRAEQLAELDNAKTVFFSNVSHELRTPLTLISGPLQDTLRETNEKKTRDKLELAARNVSRLIRLVDSLMDFSKLAAKQLQGHFRPAQLGLFTADLASLFRSTIEKTSIEFILEYDENSEVMTYVDPDWWEKIVFNLIGNAFKYTLHGTIAVRIQYTETNVLFSVEDTGVGIPPEDLDKVFNRFHRVQTVSRSFEGTGIGLSLTRELVVLHGGDLTVESRTEASSEDGSHGSKFTVSLLHGKEHLSEKNINETPLDYTRQRDYAKSIVEEAGHWSAWSESDDALSESGESAGSSSNNTTDSGLPLFFDKKDIILLVDDNTDMRRYIKALFSRYCAVVEAKNGQEALDICDQGRVRPTLVLTDVMMPVMDGYQLIQELRSRPHTRLIPVILVTANAGDEARVDGLLSGADDYLSKPFKGRELIARVHLQMQLGKRRVELEARFEERTKEIQILADLSTVGIFRTDAQGRLLYVNDRWRQIGGHPDNLPVDDWIQTLHPDDLPILMQAWREAFENHRGISMEFRYKNGTYCKGEMEPLSIDKVGLTGMIGTVTDITSQRQYEAQQLAHAQEREANARKRAEEADERRRGQELLIDVTSHELRQPVSAIINCSSLVRSNLSVLRDDLWRCASTQQPFAPLPELIKVMDEDLEALDAIYQCGLAQERIANDVLSLSRIQLQVLSIHPVEFELVPEIGRIVSIFRNEVKMKHIELTLHIGKSIDRLRIVRVCSDKSRFGQVITNLLSNAIKFTDTSTDIRTIDVTVEVSRRPPADGGCEPPPENELLVDQPLSTTLYVYVAVQDSGPGLKPDDLSLLFQRFQQGSNSHDVFGGSGLGLFVSRKLCDLMGGRIQVDSVYGQGATFRFFIEVQTATPNTPPITPEPLDKSSTVLEAKLDAPVLPLHILITEDNIINQTVLNRQLKKAGCTTALASHGLQAIEHLQAFAKLDPLDTKSPRRFDAILMDLEMPVCDGLTAVREIRQMEQSGELLYRNRVFALTGNARAAQIQSARDAGMDDVFIKPYKFDELLSKLRGSL